MCLLIKRICQIHQHLDAVASVARGTRGVHHVHAVEVALHGQVVLIAAAGEQGALAGLDTKFTLDNDETYELFEKHIDRLVTRLESKGYTCKIQFEKGHEEVDFVEDFLKQGQSVGNLQRFSFDVKA